MKNWLRYSLMGRRQRVNGKVSEWATVESGIRVVSMLGLLLCVPFIKSADIGEHPKILAWM